MTHSAQLLSLFYVGISFTAPGCGGETPLGVLDLLAQPRGPAQARLHAEPGPTAPFLILLNGFLNMGNILTPSSKNGLHITLSDLTLAKKVIH